MYGGVRRLQAMRNVQQQMHQAIRERKRKTSARLPGLATFITRLNQDENGMR